MKELYGKKLGMTQIFNEDGTVIPVTVIEAYKLVVVGKKTADKEGYNAIVVGFGDIKENRANKPQKGVFAKAGVPVKKYIKEIKSGREWVTSDPKKLDIYEKDDRCNFRFTASAFKDMLTVLKFVNSKKCFKGTNKELPIFLASGALDPVGNYGKGVCEVYGRLEKQKLKDVTLKLYPKAYHELHNEKPEITKEFMCDVLCWIKKQI